MNASQVLDQQVALVDRLATKEYVAYAGGLLDADRWRDIEPESFCRSTRHALRVAYAYHVAAPMVPLVERAAAELPDAAHIEPEHLPTQAGFVWFDQQVRLRVPDALAGFRDLVVADGDQGVACKVRAMSWISTSGPATKAGRDVGMPAEVPGVLLHLYADLEDYHGLGIDRLMAEQLPTDVDNSVQGLRVVCGRLLVEHFVFLPYHMRVGPGAYPVDDGSTVDDPMRIILAYWLLLSQTIVDVREELADRPSRRRAIRAGVPGRVTVVQLRRTHAPQGHSESIVEWSHQWVVRGHWRRQPCGIDRSERRMVWINPYVKGPEDAPLVVTDKVYTLVR